MPLISHDAVWMRIGDLAARSRKKLAAVAYVSSDVVVKFARGDTLVTDASDEIVFAGLTSGRVLQRARERGATVVSHQRLHAKVMLFDSTLVVGSANLSVNSRSRLIEASVISDSRDLVADARRLIERLVNEGEVVDDSRIAHLLDLESRRPRTSAQPHQLGESYIIFFKQVMPGDVKKYERSSAESGTGGGARDLRVSHVYWPLLRQMLAEASPKPGVTHGQILSRTTSGRFARTDVELWRPAEVRDTELRFGRIYGVPGWAIDSAAYQRAIGAGRMLFFVLEMDVFGTVFAKILTDRQLTAGGPFIRHHLAALTERRRPNRAIVGAVDLVRQVRLP